VKDAEAQEAKSGPHVAVSTDEFSKTTEIDGTYIKKNPFGGTFEKWYLRTFIHHLTGESDTGIYYVTDYNGDWRFYQNASDNSGKDFDVLNVDKSVVICLSDCLLSETISIPLTDNYLRLHKETGIFIKIYAHSGDANIINVTPEMIQEQLEAIDQYAPAEKAKVRPAHRHH